MSHNLALSDLRMHCPSTAHPTSPMHLALHYTPYLSTHLALSMAHSHCGPLVLSVP